MSEQEAVECYACGERYPNGGKDRWRRFAVINQLTGYLVSGMNWYHIHDDGSEHVTWPVEAANAMRALRAKERETRA